MTTRERNRTREKVRERERVKTREKVRERPPTVEAPPATLADADKTKAESAQRAQIKAEAAVATAGRAGERNITVAWIDVWVGNDKPVRFDIATAAGNGLEVVIEQGHYRKAYTGTSSISTLPTPVAPVGTRFRLSITDTTTGETFEQRGVWRHLGGVGAAWSSLWTAIKQLLWKG